MNGLLVIDKPSAMTSHDVVSRLRRVTGESTTGHLGTLDPLATGVLPVLLGKYTRLAQFFGPLPKTYTGAIRFGFATDTYDADGIPAAPVDGRLPSNDEIQAAAARFRGQVEQTPPPFSAKKVDGKPAYKAARRGETVVLKPVSLLIEEFVVGAREGGVCGVHHPHLVGRLCALGGSRLGKGIGLWRSSGAFAPGCRGTLYAGPGIDAGGSVRAAAAGTLEQSLPHPRTLLPDLPATTADLWVAGRLRNGNAVNLPGVLHRSAGQGVRRPARPGCHCAPRGRHALSTHRGSRLMCYDFLSRGTISGRRLSGHLRVALVRGVNAVGLHVCRGLHTRLCSRNGSSGT